MTLIWEENIIWAKTFVIDRIFSNLTLQGPGLLSKIHIKFHGS